MGDEQEDDRPHDGLDGVVGERVEIELDVLRVAHQMSGHGGKDILKCPTGHHGIETHDDEPGEHAHIAHEFPGPAAIGLRGITLRIAPHDELAEHGRKPQQEEEHQVDDEEGSTTVLPRLVGEAPDVA